MIDGGSQEGQAARHTDCTFKIQSLGGNVTLVVIQRQHRVEASCFCQVENGIGRNGAHDQVAPGLGLSHRRLNLPGLFVAEKPMFPGMWVQAGNRQRRLLDAQTRQSVSAAPDVVEQTFSGDQL